MVAVDASGRTWLDTSWGDSHDFVVIAAPTPRRVTIDGRLVNSDCYTFRFASPIVQHLKFRWRLDDGKWSEPSGSGPFALDSLPNGAHTVSVQSIDDLAIVDPVLTNETFTVNVNTAKQISGLIQRLIIGTTTDRNSAVEALARQPAAALPSLNAGLANSTDETTTWWITAAIQACERADKPL